MSEPSAMQLPPGWVLASLPDICQINPPLDRCVLNDSVPVNFVPMKAVDEEGGGVSRPESCAFAEVKKGYTPFLSGDVIMAKITPCMENGKTTVVPPLPSEVCFGSTEFHVFRPEREVEARWLAKYLVQQEFRQTAKRQMGGGVGQMRVPTTFLESVKLPLAPSSEQQRILDGVDELLSDLDAGVASLERVQKKLTHYRAAVLKAAVQGDLTAAWRAQHPDTEPASELLLRILTERRRRWEEDQLRKFKEARKEPPKNWKARYQPPAAHDGIGKAELPDSWHWVSLEQLAWAAGYGTSEKCKEDNTGIAVLRIPNISRGRLTLDNLKFAEPSYAESEAEHVAPGDLLVIRTNGSRTLIGKGAVVREAPSLALSFASYLIRLRLVQFPNLFDWVGVLWESSNVRQWVESHAATSAGQHNISLGVLETLSVPLPPLDEQEAIVEAVEAQLSIIDHLEADIAAKLKSTQGLRQSILRHAFTGQLVPQDSNDEPASELVKRIASERAERARLATKTARKQAKPPAKKTARKRVNGLA